MPPPPAACTRTSPETVVTVSPAAASSTERSPETRLADSSPPQRRTVASPDAVRSVGVPDRRHERDVTARGRDLQARRVLERHVAGRRLDVARCRACPSRRGPPSRRGGRDRCPGGSARARRPWGRGPAGARTSSRSCTTISCPPPRFVISTRASAIAWRVTSLSRNGTSSISTPGSSVASTLTSPPGSDTLQRDVARGLEDGHDRACGRAWRTPDDADAVGAVARRARLVEIGKIDAAEQ